MITAKDISSNILVPLTVFGLLAAFTIDFLVEKQDVAIVSAIETAEADYAELVSDKMNKELDIEWKTLYGGGNGPDSVIKVSDESLRVTTGVDGNWYGARTEVPAGLFASTSLSFAFQFANWDEIERAMILFSTDGEYSDYYGIDLKNYFAKPSSGEWHYVVLDTSDLIIIEGEPKWPLITDMAVRIIPKAGKSTRFWLDDFTVLPQNRTKATISMTFDDGFYSVLEAEKIMSQFDFNGTAFIVPELIGTEGYMTQSDIDNLASFGWDISGHGMTNLVDLAPVDVDTELALVREYLSKYNYQGQEHFAYPNGGYNLSVQSQVLEYFKSARTIDGFHQSPELSYPENVNAITISSQTPVADVIAEIDSAVANNTWLILVWHDFNENPARDVEYHISDFEWIINYIQKKEVEVKPYSFAYLDFGASESE